MKKPLFTSLLFVFSVLFFTLNMSVLAQSNSNTPHFDFDPNIVKNIVCAIFNCNSGGITPTPNPNPTNAPYPTAQPFPTTNPAITPPAGTCMPPGGPYSCGTRNHPINGCGHCGIGYPRASYCKADDTARNAGGNAEAIDITHKPLASVPLPFIKGHSVIWHHDLDTFFSDNSDPYASYQEYSGTDTVTRKKYIIRYLHTQHRSGIPLGTNANSGVEGVKVCLQWVRNGAVTQGNHIHIQIYDGQIKKWVEATDYYCN
ncbi:hypothetical protein A3D80_00435 [Candidatus Roizmanbacteria bacterium RIFCSPHIGHO2_02_FULL_40_13b]|nr:MAG: hypothetical protein A3D80_00435 [Candidatus Roizmanbacteria bacterium RIFCSPHIGHO2_02_FULL_40_13b]OGK56398.1 MAG: hypothetical protein A3H83_01115 [Candidatus Roizmanbacteria bacterium RIFCSPLOWO2_02_FULL_39_8]